MPVKLLPLLAAALAALAGCASSLPDASPALVDMVEPLELFAEPDDEALRRGLPAGGFTGVQVEDARQTLDAILGGEAAGIEVVRIVENSPADVAGLAVGDLLLEARLGDGPMRSLQFPSVWRELELEAGGDLPLTVVFDRANRRTQARIDPLPRVRPPAREAVQRLREEARIGVVVRTATEVEARAAGLAPGAGAVIVGLSKRSPFRDAGLRFGDLLTALDGREVAHPGLVLDAIAAAGDSIRVGYVRDGVAAEVDAPTTRRARDLREIYVPLLFDHESERGRSDTSVLLGLFRYEETEAAWRVRLLWLIRFGGGDADELLEVDG
jgi:C-terminal processing protease CtpA/Prc